MHSGCCAWNPSPLKLMGVLSWASIRKRFPSQEESSNSIPAPIHNYCLSRSNHWDNNQPEIWMLLTKYWETGRWKLLLLSLPSVFIHTIQNIVTWMAHIYFPLEISIFHRNAAVTTKTALWYLSGCPALKSAFPEPKLGPVSVITKVYSELEYFHLRKCHFAEAKLIKCFPKTLVERSRW